MPGQILFEGKLLRALSGQPEKVSRPLFGIRISYDHGNTWSLRALCVDCQHSIEPPTRATNEGRAGAVKCDWCGALNEE